MLDILIKEYGDACAQKQKAKDNLRHYIQEARDARLFPSIYSPHKHHYLLNSSNDWVDIVLKWEEIVKWKKEILLNHIANMELYKNAA